MRFRLSPRLAVLPVLAAALFLPTVHDIRLDAASESVRDMAPATPESVGMSADREEAKLRPPEAFGLP